MGEKIVIRRKSGPIPPEEFPQPAEPFFDMDRNALAFGAGDAQPREYPGLKKDGGWVLYDYKMFYSHTLTSYFGFSAEKQFVLNVFGESVFTATNLKISFQKDIELQGSSTFSAGSATYSGSVSILKELDVGQTTTFRGVVNFLGGINLSLASFAAGIIPTNFNNGDIFVAGTPHTWKSPQTLLYNSRFAASIIAVGSSEAGIDFDTIPGRYSVLYEGYPALGTLGATVEEVAGTESGIVFTRASQAGHINADGNFSLNTVNRSRMQFDFTSYEKLGLSLSGPSANSVQSAGTLAGSSVGIVAVGQQGSLPTGWSFSGMPANGVVTVQAIETFRGLPSIVIRLQGSNSTGSTINPRINLSNPTSAVLQNQTLVGSVYAKVESALVPPDQLTLNVRTVNASNNQVDAPVTSPNMIFATSAATRAVTPALVASLSCFIDPYVTFPVNNGAGFDFIIRLALPMVEKLPMPSYPYLEPTRAGEILKFPASPRIMRPTEGTILIRFRPKFVLNNPYGTTTTLWVANADSSGSGLSDMMRLIVNNTGNLVFQSYVNNGLTAQLDLGALTAGTLHRVAIAYKRNDYAGILSGNPIATDTVAEVPTLSTQWLGSNGIDSWFPIDLLKFKTFRRRLSNAELTSIVA